jgi:hypothetical protein
MAKRKRQQLHRLRPGEATVIESRTGQAIVAPVIVRRRVHLMPVNDAVIRRLRVEADSKENGGCSGK